jgi:hypothetical protein
LRLTGLLTAGFGGGSGLPVFEEAGTGALKKQAALCLQVDVNEMDSVTEKRRTWLLGACAGTAAGRVAVEGRGGEE